MTVAHITALPTPPSRGDDPSGFSTKADAFLGALPTFRTEANTLADAVEALNTATQGIYDDAVADTTAIKVAAEASLSGIAAANVSDMNAIKTTTDGYKTAAQSAQTAAEAARDTAQGYRDTALTHATTAGTYRDQAQTAAAAAGASAGLPSLTGKAGKTLQVAAGETGVQWGDAAQVPIDSFILINRSANSLAAQGATYLKSGVTADRSLYPSAEIVTYLAGTSSARSGGTIQPGEAFWKFGSDYYAGSSSSTSLKAMKFSGGAFSEITIGASTNYIRRIVANATRLMAILYGASTSSVYTSTDGSSWGNQTLPASGNWSGCAAASGFMVYNGTNSYYSATGATGSWTNATLPLNGTAASSGALATLAGISQTYYTSSDCATWTARTFPVAPASQSLVFGYSPQASLWLAWEANSATTHIYSSSDGINWTDRGVPPVAMPASVYGVHVVGDRIVINGGAAIVVHRKSDFTDSGWILDAMSTSLYTVPRDSDTLTAVQTSATQWDIDYYSGGLVGSLVASTANVGGNTIPYYKRVS